MRRWPKEISEVKFLDAPVVQENHGVKEYLHLRSSNPIASAIAEFITDFRVGKHPDTRLGAILYQLPPFFKCDVPKLEMFLSVLPRGIRATFEFRHDSWFIDDTYRLLRKHNAALCIHDADDHTTPMEITAGFTYVRLRRSEYDVERRREWQNQIRQWSAQGIEVLAYIKHEDNPNAPLIALDFAQGLT